MDRFKRFSELLEPDPIQTELVLWDHKSGRKRPFTLKALYRDVRVVTLHRHVPVEVRRHFQRAKNLLVYSWFVFSFAMCAQLQAYITVEMALRMRLGMAKAPFRSLLTEAIRQGLVTAEGFPSLDELRTERVFSVGPELFGDLSALIADGLTQHDYHRTLLDVISRRLPRPEESICSRVHRKP